MSRAEDWDPRSERVLRDHLGSVDKMRVRCPVAHSRYLGWSVFRHVDVRRVLQDTQTFSNVVSKHVAVPNGMDPPRHTIFRNLIEPYFSPRRIEAFEPICRSIAVALVDELPGDGEDEVMETFARHFALRVQCAFMGWSDDVHEALRSWLERSQKANLLGSREEIESLAEEFTELVRSLLRSHAEGGPDGDDVTSRLRREHVEGRRLTESELTSIIRNWTVGELQTIAAAVGIIIFHLAGDLELQRHLRDRPSDIPLAVEEILRLDAPLLTNRRAVTRPVELGGRRLQPGDRVTVMWAAANRDPEIFENAGSFQLNRDQSDNLLWGAGIHRCPGASLAQLELRVLMEVLLSETSEILPAESRSPVRAVYPAGGFAELPVMFRRHRS